MGDQPIMAAADDAGEVQCTDHPYRNNPGGICAFCLQEKLGKLVSSSNSSSPFLSIPLHPSSSSSSPSFCSDYGTMGTASSGPTRTAAAAASGGRMRVPFLSITTTHKKKSSSSTTATALLNNSSSKVLKRSKSVAPRPTSTIGADTAIDTPRKKSFWSYFYHSSSSSSASGAENGSSRRDLRQRKESDSNKVKTMTTDSREDQEAESPGGSQASASSFGRKVARSRSVGCGSRSFSGDFLERISTGFGDCTLRRVESQRESNNKKMLAHDQHENDEQRIKERVKCGGIFGGFGMISSSSSTYWLSAAAATTGDENFDTPKALKAKTAGGRGRSRNWGWAFASPMRAFKPATTSSTSSKTYTPSTSIRSINASATAVSNANMIIGDSRLAVK